MPRRSTELAQLPLPPKKKIKPIQDLPEPSTTTTIPSLDVSFCDDEALPPGIVFTDVNQKKWKLGKPIGRGSFGRIYLASDEINKEVSKLTAQYVVKIEPHTNGPLFVEIHCLKRNAKVEKVKEWRQVNNQKRLGMPVYIASGSFTDENSGTKYRFLILPRYDVDLHKLIAVTKVLDVKHVLILAIQILDVLEYLHNEGYTHSDIKSSNLMVGHDYIGKVPIVKLSPPFQKDLSSKIRKTKPGKSKTSNYYIDEDFIMKDYKSPTNSEDENEKRLANVKRRLRKILTDKDSRNLHRHHAFNLRQLSNYANYEDMNSSVCSDQSYQKLIDDFGNKSVIQTTEEFRKSKARSAQIKNETENVDELYKEAILSQSTGQIYLLDYGLASKFLDSEGNHKDFGMDARKAHDGTLEYSSRDSHIGAHSRRSDLETLGYNLLEWLTGTLPWKTAEVLAEPDLVHALKKNYMSDIKLLLKTCFKTEFYPQFMEKYLEYITGLDFTEKPDYNFCRNLFKTELCKNGNMEATLNFRDVLKPHINRQKLCAKFGRKHTPPNFFALNGIRKVRERENVFSLENDLKLDLLRQALNTSSDGVRKPCASRNFFVSDADLIARLKKSLMPHGVFGKKLSPKNLRSKKKTVQKRKGIRRHRNSIGKFGNFMGSARQFTWAEILAQNPEDIIRKERNAASDEDDDDTCKYRIRKLSSASEGNDSNIQSPLLQKDYLQDMNPTDAMKDVINSLKTKISGKVPKEPEENLEGFKGYTPAMIKVYKMKEKREAKEKLEALKQSSPKTDVQTQRCTRSSQKRNKKPPELQTTTRVTRQKNRTSMESIEKTNKNASKRTRSNVRSKSKCKSVEQTDGEATTKVKVRSKSKSKSIEKADDNTATKSNIRSRSKSKYVEKTDDDAANKSNDRSRSKSKNVEMTDDDAATKSNVRSRSKSKYVEKTDDDAATKSNVRSRSKSKYVEMIDDNAVTKRNVRSRSKSKYVEKTDDDEATKNNVRSRSKSKYVEMTDDDATTKRNGRSRSKSKYVEKTDDAATKSKVRTLSKCKSVDKTEKHATTNRNVRSKSKCKTIVDKKEVKIVKDAKPVAEKPAKKSSPRLSAATIPNTRLLRSSKRNK